MNLAPFIPRSARAPWRPPSAASVLWGLALLCACPRSDKDETESLPETETHTETSVDLSTEITLTLDVAEIDECDTLCGAILARVDGQPASNAIFRIESDREGFLPGLDSALDADGYGSFCIDTPLTTGAHRLAVHIEGATRVFGYADVTVHPFGYRHGLAKPAEALTALPWTPTFTPDTLTADPVLPYTDSAWDSYSVMMPSTVELSGTRFLYYAGTDDQYFSLGVATENADGTFGKYAGNPILTAAETGAAEGDWDYFSQNTPTALVRDDAVWLYYNARDNGEQTGTLSIGLATSTDGFTFTRAQDTPVFGPVENGNPFDARGVAHPSIVVRPTDREGFTGEVFELWFAAGNLSIGYALSTDGVTFDRYCANPVFTGDADGWDQGAVKAPEVVHDGESYFMTYSGCGEGCYEVGWAASSDGIRWVSSDEPLIPAQVAPAWNSYGTQSAFIDVDADTWRFWYAGTGQNHGQIGRLETTRE